MRVDARRDHGLVPARDAMRHEDRFPHRRRAVVHGRIGNFAAQQARNLRLKFEQHLQRALRDLGLVRGVARQELAALDDVVDARRHMMAIGAATEKEWCVARGQVLARQRRHVPFDCHFRRVHGQARDRILEAERFRNVAEQLVDRTGAAHAQHFATIGGGKWKVTHQAQFSISGGSGLTTERRVTMVRSGARSLQTVAAVRHRALT